MSHPTEHRKPLLSIAEQEVQIVVSEMVAKAGGKIPGLSDVQAALIKRGFKHRSISNISRILTSLELKGRIRVAVEVL